MIMINRSIQSMEDKYLLPSLELIEQVFTEYENEQEGKTVRKLTEEIRSLQYYFPALEIIALDDEKNIIGYAQFSRFHLEGKYENELLILTPVAVKTCCQRQHISKDMIEYGFEKAKEMGFKAVIVEGNPLNYRARGFVTAADHGILPGKTVHLPHIDCLMVKELIPGALENIKGHVEYDCYQTLT